MESDAYTCKNDKLIYIVGYASIPLAVIGVAAARIFGLHYVGGCLVILLVQLLFCVSALLWISREDREEFFTPDRCLKWRFGVWVNLLGAILLACGLVWLGGALVRNFLELKESFSGFPPPLGLLAVIIFWALLFCVAAVAVSALWMNLAEHCLARWMNRRNFCSQAGLIAEPGNREQTERDLSFIGGYPLMAEAKEFPECSVCGAPQTFFFQVTFPEGHRWYGHTLAAFLCTSCMDANHCIPEIFSDGRRNPEIPIEFLESYQKNFRFVTTPLSDCVIRTDYQPKIQFQPLVFQKKLPRMGWIINIESPDWIEDDESPGKMEFLCQLAPNYQFLMAEGAPPQTVMNIAGNQVAADKNYYEYFIGNSVYLFGPEKPDNRLVYTVVQGN